MALLCKLLAAMVQATNSRTHIPALLLYVIPGIIVEALFAGQRTEIIFFVLVVALKLGILIYIHFAYRILHTTTITIAQ